MAETWSTRWRSWLRHCGTKLNGRWFDFQWYHFSFFFIDIILNLGSIKPLTEMNTRNISWELKSWQPYRLNVPNVHKSGSLSLPEPWLVTGLYRDCCVYLYICQLCNIEEDYVNKISKYYVICSFLGNSPASEF